MTTQATTPAPSAPSVTVGHGPITIAGLFTAGVGFLGAVAVGATTVAGALPKGVPVSVGEWITGIGVGAGTFALALVAAAREYRARTKAMHGLFDPPAPQ
jgi:hypothetical protein